MSTTIELFVFARLSTNGADIKYRHKIYDWAGNVVGVGQLHGAEITKSVANLVTTHKVPIVEPYHLRYFLWY